VEFTAYDLTSNASEGASAWRPTQASMPHAEAYRHSIEQAQIADRAGLDGWFVTEHHFNPGFQIVPSPHLLVAALSQVTSRIRLGVMCTNLSLYHPVRVAEEIRMMDLLTGGRLEMGFGRGTAGHEHAGYGVNRAETETLFDESFALIRRLLTEDHVDGYDTGPWHGDGVTLAPEATQRPHPRLWLTGISEKSIRKAARLQLDLCTAFLDGADTERTAGIYRDEWAEAHPGIPVGRYGTLQHVFVAETEADARRWGQPHLEDWINAGLEAVVSTDGNDGSGDKGYEEHLRYFQRITGSPFDEAVANGRIIFGTPDQAVEQLVAKAAAGVDMFQGWFQFGGLDFAASDRSLELFCREVVPAVRRRLGQDTPAVTPV
jgi:alkanesulfonate monooxygenase SsuD/methylene tetrahydromethanopterin reductase-like flavin-dependent oxidoreductase (luciferase family)